MNEQSRDLFLAADGDDRAFARLVRSTEADLRRFCKLLGVAQADIDDVLQETFVKAHRGLASYRAAGSALSWLFTIARRTCLDHFRRTRRESEITDAVSMSEPHHEHGSSDFRWLELMELVARLPSDFKESFALVRIFGFSYEDAAAIIGCPRGTVQSRVARARVTLAAALSESDATRAS